MKSKPLAKIALGAGATLYGSGLYFQFFNIYRSFWQFDNFYNKWQQIIYFGDTVILSLSFVSVVMLTSSIEKTLFRWKLRKASYFPEILRTPDWHCRRDNFASLMWAAIRNGRPTTNSCARSTVRHQTLFFLSCVFDAPFNSTVGILWLNFSFLFNFLSHFIGRLTQSLQ